MHKKLVNFMNFIFLAFLKSFSVHAQSLDDLEVPLDRTTMAELSALERLKIECLHFLSVAFDPIIFKLAVNKKMHTIIS